MEPIHHIVEQNTDEWYKLRTGIPTASGFDNIITPAKGEYSDSSEKYMNHLLGERLVGHVLEFQSKAMQEGHDREEESRKAFSVTTGLKVIDGGFWTTADGRIGVSPDGLIEDDGLFEAKNPEVHTHIGYMRTKRVDRKYWVQLQTGLFVTGRKFYMIQSYYPELRSVIIRVERDEPYIAKIKEHGNTFCNKLESEWELLKASVPSINPQP